MSSLITITRRIQLLFNTNNKAEIKEYYNTLWRWQRIVFKAANMVATHHFCQENIKDIMYLTEEMKVKLGDAKKDELGILTTSKQNSTYQVLSKHFKGTIPTSILTALNSTIVQTFNKEKKEYFTGKRSLRSYRSDIPIPFQAASIINMRKHLDKYMGKEYANFAFTLHNIPFRTMFGRDLSRNKETWQRMLKGEYHLADSSIQLDGNKVFLLAVFRFEKENYKLDPEIIAECTLDVEIPIIVKIGNKEYQIGNKEEFLNRRVALQGSVRRLQKAITFNADRTNRRSKKLQALDKVKDQEGSYVKYKIHQYTRKLVDIALKNHAGVILLKNQTKKENEAKLDEVYLLRNWSYFDAKEKIRYKGAKVGIELKIE